MGAFMGKIVICMGKSASGKDSVIREILKNNKYNLQNITMSTTRPIRFGELHGREYFFNTEEERRELERKHKIIECRTYHTEHGIWHYYTTNQNIDLKKHNYITSNTLEGLDKYIEYYGKEKIISLLFELEDGERLERALNRERQQENPKYKELCRRFLSDSEDFSLENIKKRPITAVIDNGSDLNKTVEKVNKVLSLHLQ